VGSYIFKGFTNFPSVATCATPSAPMIKHALEVAVCARKRSAYDARMTRRLIGLFGIFCALVASPLSAQARGLRVAIFDFELIDTSLEGATNGSRAGETARLVRLGDQLRTLVTSSGKLEVIDCSGAG
jgi:hypothetical protein